MEKKTYFKNFINDNSFVLILMNRIKVNNENAPSEML